MHCQFTGYFQDASEFTEPLTVEKYNQIKGAKNTCLFALELEEKLNLLLDNYNELETDLLALAQSHLLWSSLNHASAMRDRLLLDRRFANLLTGCRLYIDHTKHALSAVFGASSKELLELENFKKTLYDSRFGFRFMEALRNHVQVIVNRFQNDLETWKSAMDEYSTRQTQILIAPKLVLFSDESKKIDEIHLVSEFLGYYEELKSRNCRIPELRRSFSSNSDQKCSL